MKYRIGKGKVGYLKRAGFLPEERQEIASSVSPEGLLAPYFQRMIRSRRALQMNASKYSWSDYHYRERVMDYYRAKGLLGEGEAFKKEKVWELLRWFSEQYPPPSTYDSPWAMRKAKKDAQKKRRKRVTRADMLRQRIADIDRRYPKVKSEYRRRKMLEQRVEYERQLGILI